IRLVVIVNLAVCLLLLCRRFFECSLCRFHHCIELDTVNTEALMFECHLMFRTTLTKSRKQIKQATSIGERRKRRGRRRGRGLRRGARALAAWSRWSV